MKCKIGMVKAEANIDIQKNVELIKEYAEEASKQGCCAICFPEAFLTGYAPAEVENRALSRSGDWSEGITYIAEESGIDILIGLMEKAEEGFYITHCIFYKDGRIDYYRKTHLGLKERTIFKGGNELKVYQLSNGLKLGFQICMEMHFPEVTQTLSMKGAQLVLAPFAVPGTPEKREEVWEKIIPARGYDYRVYVACCNLWGSGRFGGGLIAVNPAGEIMGEDFSERNSMLIFEVDTEVVEQYHRESVSMKYRYYPKLRIPELYC